VAYHESFWLAVAAATPVIALANTVSINDVVRLWLNVKVSRRSAISRERYISVIFFSTFNLILQSIFLFVTLFSLADEKDIGSRVLAATFTSFGIIYLGIIVIYNVRLRYALHREEAKGDEAKPVLTSKDRKSTSGLGWPDLPRSS
jgi:hypothetical protein